LTLAGLASCLLFASLFLSFVFLLPVQIVNGRFGRRAGWASAGVAAAGIVVVQLWGTLSSATTGFWALDLASGALPPVILLAALSLINAPIWGLRTKPYRVIIVSMACALAALPFLLSIERDTSIASYLEGKIGSVLAPFRSTSGEGYEASALAASLDPKELVATSMNTLRDSFAAIILVIIGGSWRLGNRLSGPGSGGRAETCPIEALRLPYPLVWAFLASWSLVLAAVVLRAGEALTAFAWNCAVVSTLLYAAQGWGIVTHLFKSWNMPRSLRLLMGAMAVIAFFTPTAGFVVAATLPLLGVTEIWIPYRKPKGAGA